MEAERKGAEAHLKSCEAEHLLSQATELTQSAADARAKESEVRQAPQLFVLLAFSGQPVLLLAGALLLTS